MQGKQPELWVCQNCWTVMPRIEAEQLAHGGNFAIPDLTCSLCNAIGHLVPDCSPEFASFANDLVFEAYAAKLQEAGYEVPAYSAQCDQGSHDLCDGKSRFVGEIAAFLDRCSCPCHEIRGKEQR